MTVEFKGWPKISRLFRDMVITEKIDGTNAAVIVTEDGEVAAQSRTRLITPENDNFGFAGWVAEHEDELRETLGVGRHFGEWWGKGIQRAYGISERRFSLFNVSKYADLDSDLVRTVPVLYEGPFDTETVDEVLDVLRVNGSVAEPGFIRPEGIVVFHVASNTMFKVTVENDESPKGQNK